MIAWNEANPLRREAELSIKWYVMQGQGDVNAVGKAPAG